MQDFLSIFFFTEKLAQTAKNVLTLTLGLENVHGSTTSYHACVTSLVYLAHQND